MPKVTFIDRKGKAHEVDAPNGMTLLRVAQQNGLDLEGACDHSLACATCHVVVDPASVPLLEDPKDDEQDMLDLALNLTKTSRLACQIVIREELDGLRVTLAKK